MNLENRNVIITGISRGIGKELTFQLIEKGAKVFGIGKTEPDYKSNSIRFVKCDIRKQQEVKKATEEILNSANTIDVLINNAGLGYFGDFEKMPEEEFFEIYEVNVFGLYYLCKEIIPVMKEANYGHIINISSIAGLEGMQQVAAYCGAKHAVRGITDSLFRELRGWGIKVTGVYPGSVQTDFFNNSKGLKAHDMMLQPADVARQIIAAIETPDNFLMNTLVFRPLNLK